ncbi:hypothetical protein TVAG_423650 [Trichomonas vaginalis G3]|uniref:Uncharacterized protein n=1 Tax=Trichomonas vaginalis (strain ATCC PRA-98 / G3) TaxID=412133 RepID=A2DTK3_TRIV3|nr:hypothetical protein TVAGG3_0594070 [Trichomonas vaginalis G3]EAY16312.1 hypothetical protein TVAG_423650 [Trichomonas vaginalis G3]KAI5523472.1 hypothetical protein TVAGG3_0594070 [Trichomonas vaginalis G3]|eukprot:XP_001328535.1 hypothetical protein [Trichomonas vaginalis G3]
MILVAISAGLYEMSDLSDVIKPDEAKYTQMMKFQAKREAKIKEARELLKKMEEEEAKRKTQEEEGKIKTE